MLISRGLILPSSPLLPSTTEERAEKASLITHACLVSTASSHTVHTLDSLFLLTQPVGGGCLIVVGSIKMAEANRWAKNRAVFLGETGREVHKED